jgi:hypothetical protein
MCCLLYILLPDCNRKRTTLGICAKYVGGKCDTIMLCRRGCVRQYLGEQICYIGYILYKDKGIIKVHTRAQPISVADVTSG